MGSRLSQWILDTLGWRIEAPFDIRQIPHAVVVVMPHTSNWDFPLGLLVRSAMNWDVRYAAKDSIFKGPLGAIFKALGGYPVDRSKSNNFTEAVADLFRQHPEFYIAITPEGTRSRVTRLKSGFYYIARDAGVPLILVAMDFGTKVVRMSQPVSPELTYQQLLAVMADFYKGAVGRNPELGFDFDQYIRDEAKTE